MAVDPPSGQSWPSRGERGASHHVMPLQFGLEPTHLGRDPELHRNSNRKRTAEVSALVTEARSALLPGMSSSQRRPSEENLSVDALQRLSDELREQRVTEPLAGRRMNCGPPPGSAHSRRIRPSSPGPLQLMTTHPPVVDKAPCFDALVASSCSAKPMFWTAFAVRKMGRPLTRARVLGKQLKMSVHEVAHPGALPVLPQQHVLGFGEALKARRELRHELVDAAALFGSLRAMPSQRRAGSFLGARARPSGIRNVADGA